MGGPAAAAPQADNVEPAKGHGFARSHHERRDILPRTRTAANHHITAYATELMDQHGGTDIGIIVDDDLPGNLGGVSDNAAVAELDIVRNVRSLHNKVAIPHDGLPLGSRTTVYRHILADSVVIADLGRRVLPAEFQVLRDSPDHGAREKHVTASRARTVKQGDAVHQLVVVADNHAAVDEAERADFAVLADAGFGVDVS